MATADSNLLRNAAELYFYRSAIGQHLRKSADASSKEKKSQETVFQVDPSQPDLLTVAQSVEAYAWHLIGAEMGHFNPPPPLSAASLSAVAWMRAKIDETLWPSPFIAFLSELAQGGNSLNAFGITSESLTIAEKEVFQSALIAAESLHSGVILNLTKSLITPDSKLGEILDSRVEFSSLYERFAEIGGIDTASYSPESLEDLLCGLILLLEAITSLSEILPALEERYGFSTETQYLGARLGKIFSWRCNLTNPKCVSQIDSLLAVLMNSVASIQENQNNPITWSMIDVTSECASILAFWRFITIGSIRGEHTISAVAQTRPVQAAYGESF